MAQNDIDLMLEEDLRYDVLSKEGTQEGFADQVDEDGGERVRGFDGFAEGEV